MAILCNDNHKIYLKYHNFSISQETQRCIVENRSLLIHHTHCRNFNNIYAGVDRVWPTAVCAIRRIDLIFDFFFLNNYRILCCGISLTPKPYTNTSTFHLIKNVHTLTSAGPWAQRYKMHISVRRGNYLFKRKLMDSHDAAAARHTLKNGIAIKQFLHTLLCVYSILKWEYFPSFAHAQAGYLAARERIKCNILLLLCVVCRVTFQCRHSINSVSHSAIECTSWITG